MQKVRVVKRVYKNVDIGSEKDHWPVLLDGKPAKTPAGHVLTCPNKEIAKAVALEWEEQEKDVNHHDMPLTQIQITRLDFVDQREEEAIEKLLEYIDTDLLFYRTPYPKELHDKQNRLWGSWLDWMTGRFMVHFETTTDIKVIEQEKALHDTLEGYIRGLNKNQLSVFYILVNLCGSIIMPLAMIEKEADPKDLFKVARLEELYKEDLLEELDPEIHEAHEKLQHELMACKLYLDLLESENS